MKTLQEQLDIHLLSKQPIIPIPILKEVSVSKRIKWDVEAVNVHKLSLQGKTLKEIGSLYKVSGSRIGQILQKYYPELPASERGMFLKASNKRKTLISERYQRTGRHSGQHLDDLSRAVASFFSRKKQNAKCKQWEWAIFPTDLTYPMVCPILGIELDWFAEKRQENSPSIDRVDSTKGYIPGNVVVCSWRANRIKNDGTAEEHSQIADFLTTFKKDTK